MPSADPSRILLIRPSALGDVCRSAPVLASLRHRFPEARIDWLVRDTFVDAVRAHPALTNVLPFPRSDMGRWWTPRGAVALRDFLRMVRSPRYDLVIDAQGLFRSAVFALSSGAPRRLGDRRASEVAWLAYSTRVRTNPATHVVDQMLALANAAGAEPLPDARLFTPPDVALPAETPDAGSCAILAPTSAWPGKCWPASRFAQFTKQLLHDEFVDRIAIVGSANERDQIPELLALASMDDRIADLVGRTSVGQLMKLIERGALVVANDSAAMHMAVGFDRPLVALLGPTDAALAGPYRRRDAVVQATTPNDRLTHRACKNAAHGRALMSRITVDMTLAKAREQLSGVRSADHPSTDDHTEIGAL